MQTPESLNAIASDLIRRGLPAPYAERAAAEFVDHYQDLSDELNASNWNESQAALESTKRLGTAQDFVAKTVREYRRRYWSARWPAVTFLLAPIPTLFVAWLLLANILWLLVVIATKLGLTATPDAQAAFISLHFAVKFACIATAFLVVPAVTMVSFGKLAQRAAVSGKWILVTGCLLGLFAGAFRWERALSDSLPTLTDVRTGQTIQQPHRDFFITMELPLVASQNWIGSHHRMLPRLAQCCQLLLPIAVAGMFLFLRQQRAQTELRTLRHC